MLLPGSLTVRCLWIALACTPSPPHGQLQPHCALNRPSSSPVARPDCSAPPANPALSEEPGDIAQSLLDLFQVPVAMPQIANELSYRAPTAEIPGNRAQPVLVFLDSPITYRSSFEFRHRGALSQVRSESGFQLHRNHLAWQKAFLNSNRRRSFVDWTSAMPRNTASHHHIFAARQAGSRDCFAPSTSPGF